MCEWGTTVPLEVTLPPRLSSTGRKKICVKPVDSCIAPIVKALNDAGILTTGCCCGHGKARGWIGLHDGRELVIKGAA